MRAGKRKENKPPKTSEYCWSKSKSNNLGVSTNFVCTGKPRINSKWTKKLVYSSKILCVDYMITLSFFASSKTWRAPWGYHDLKPIPKIFCYAVPRGIVKRLKDTCHRAKLKRMRPFILKRNYVQLNSKAERWRSILISSVLWLMAYFGFHSLEYVSIHHKHIITKNPFSKHDKSNLVTRPQ